MPPTERSLQNLKPMEPGEPARKGSGRPKGSLNAKTIIERWLRVKEVQTNPITQKRMKLSQLDIMTLAMIKQSRSGNVQAFNALLDRTEGKPEQKNINSFEEGTDIVVTIGKPKLPNHSAPDAEVQH